jgi:hypothetical protein
MTMHCGGHASHGHSPTACLGPGGDGTEKHRQTCPRGDKPQPTTTPTMAADGIPPTTAASLEHGTKVCRASIDRTSLPQCTEARQPPLQLSSLQLATTETDMTKQREQRRHRLVQQEDQDFHPEHEQGAARWSHNIAGKGGNGAHGRCRHCYLPRQPELSVTQ